MALIYCDGDTPVAQGYAKGAAEVLVQTYPNHSWWVECRGGVLIIKHFEASGLRGSIGMVKHTSNMDHDAKVWKHDVVMSAGELLERAGLKRGANNGDAVQGLEIEDVRMRKHWHRPLKVDVIH